MNNVIRKSLMATGAAGLVGVIALLGSASLTPQGQCTCPSWVVADQGSCGPMIGAGGDEGHCNGPTLYAGHIIGNGGRASFTPGTIIGNG